MRLKIFGALFGFLFLACPVYAQPEIKAIEEPMPIEKAFKLNPIDLEPETKTALVDATLEPGFSKKAGGDLFVAKFGTDAFRYEYEGEWIEFEPLNHLPVLAASATNELYFPNYWTDTNLRFTVRDYGVKVDIILMSDVAPKEFSFRVSKSAKWQDEWIKPSVAHEAIPVSTPVPVEETLFEGVLTYKLPDDLSKARFPSVLTYKLPDDLSKARFPIMLDPTLELGHSHDDTVWRTIGSDSNFDTLTYNAFGAYKVGATNYAEWTMYRFALDLPRASKVNSAKLYMKACYGHTGSFNTTIYGLAKDNKWEATNGFATSNYANGSACAAISEISTSVSWSPVAAWVLNNWHYSPEAATIVQALVDISIGSNKYDPTHSEDKHIGLEISPGAATYKTWAASGDVDIRYPYSYDHSAANASELVITYDPWGTVMVQGGFRLDSDGLKYYGY